MNQYRQKKNTLFSL